MACLNAFNSLENACPSNHPCFPACPLPAFPPTLLPGRYAYSIAAATALDKPVRHKTILEIQLQPPWDASLKAQASVTAGLPQERCGCV